MIFYYSATGNSRFAALSLAGSLRCEAIDILAAAPPQEKVREAATVGFVFPIYCWGVTPVMSDFVGSMLDAADKDAYVWALCTCGDEAGVAMRDFDKLVRRWRGRGADALFSLIMPNTYVLLPGFDVDSRQVEEDKLREAPARLRAVAQTVAEHRPGIYDVHEGSLPALRTRLLFPLFEKWGVFPSKWKASSACIGCGRCAASCPAANISMSDGRPRWGSRCFSCCACFHVCPVKAVSYGRFTRDKSQYVCPLSTPVDNLLG